MGPTTWAILSLFVLVVAAAPNGSAAAAAVQSYRLVPGTPTESAEVFLVPVFVLGEPAGSPANQSDVRQVWEDLTILYLNETPGQFENWSVPSWGAGRFDLRLVLAAPEVGDIEAGQALLALNSSVAVGSAIYGAAGLIDGTVLSSSVVEGAWWNTLFDIQNAPPVLSPHSLPDVVEDLAWFGSSTAGRALYAAVTLCAVGVYVFEAQKLAKERLANKPRTGGSNDRD